MRRAYSSLTGWVDGMDTLESVGRRGRDGPVEEGGPSERRVLSDGGSGLRLLPAEGCLEWPGDNVMPAKGGNPSSPAESISITSGRHRTSERLMSTGSAVNPWRLKSSTITLGW